MYFLSFSLFKILSFQYMTLVTFQALSSCLWVAVIWDSTALEERVSWFHWNKVLCLVLYCLWPAFFWDLLVLVYQLNGPNWSSLAILQRWGAGTYMSVRLQAEENYTFCQLPWSDADLGQAMDGSGQCLPYRHCILSPLVSLPSRHKLSRYLPSVSTQNKDCL